MIKCHPNIDDSTFKQDIKIAIKEAGLTGYISIYVLRQFFNLFSWVYLTGTTTGAFQENTAMTSFLSRFDLFRFKGSSLCYSAVLFYQKLSKSIDLRKLELGDISSASIGANKAFTTSSFTYEELYKVYAESEGDLSEDFLLFNDLFKKVEEKTTKKLTSYGEITKVLSCSSLVRPDLAFKIVTNKLDIGFNEEKEEKKKNKLYVLQDCTGSMQRYINQLKILKAFILDTAFTNDYEIEWIFVSNIEHGRALYNKENIKSISFDFLFCGSKINLSTILNKDEFIGKQVVIITDGTDSFNFTFATKTDKINVISFIDSLEIKDKISNYGRFFKVSLY